jgi:hypothetical protein
MEVINSAQKQMFVSVYLCARLEPTLRVGPLKLQLWTKLSKILSLPTNIRLGWTLLTAANTLAY